METDIQRLNQILKNLLSNSFKFTEKGEVKLKIYEAKKNWKPGNPTLIMQKELLHLPSVIQVLVFRRKNKISSSKHSSRQKDLPAVNMVEQDLGFRSAVVLQNCLVVPLNWKVSLDMGSTFTLFLPIENVADGYSKEAADNHEYLSADAAWQLIQAILIHC